MANQHLKNKTYKIPENLLKSLRDKLAAYENSGGDKSLAGYTRLKNLANSGTITYSNMYFIKGVLEKNRGNQVYELNGGKPFEDWLNGALKIDTTNVANHKKAKEMSGQENAYIKSHNKDSAANPTTLTKPGEIRTSIKDLYAESKKTVMISEEHYKMLLLLINQ